MTVQSNGEQLILVISRDEKEQIRTSLQNAMKYRQLDNICLGVIKRILQGVK